MLSSTWVKVKEAKGEIPMPIRYILFRNGLLDDPRKHIARSKPYETIDREELIRRICEIETTVGEADIRSVLAVRDTVIERLLLDGNSVVTPLAVYGAGIKGVFEGVGDHYDPKRHQIRPLVHPGHRLRKAFKVHARAVKAEWEPPTPSPRTYIDIGSGQDNSILTPGGIGILRGYRLKFDPTDPEQGILFVPKEQGLQTDPARAVRVPAVAQNTSRKLIFTVPALPPGDYQLRVRAILRRRTDLREGTLLAMLTVAEAGA
jgi:hypothetical protein